MSKTVVKPYQLRKKDACSKARMYQNYAGTRGKTASRVEVAGVTKSVLKEWTQKLYEINRMPKGTDEEIDTWHRLQKGLEEEMKSRLEEQYANISFLAAREREENMKGVFERIKRYVESECIPSKKHNWAEILPEYKDLDLPCNIEVKDFKPDFIDFTESDGSGSWDIMLTIVTIMTGKNYVKPTNVLMELVVALPLFYGRELVKNASHPKFTPGTRVKIVASIRALKKDSDRAGDAEKSAVFEPDFFHTVNAYGREITSSNIQEIEGVYTVPAPGAEIEAEERFNDACDLFARGIPVLDHCEADCKKCDFNLVCNFKKPPLVEEIKEGEKSVKGVRFSKEQQEIINFDKGVLRVNACAGSGKTFTLGMSVLSLIDRGVQPDHILVVAFMNIAAAEIRSRLIKMAEKMEIEGVEKVMVVTCNSLGQMILDDRYEVVGYSEKPSVNDEEETFITLKPLLDEFPVDGLDYANFTDSMYIKGALPMAARILNIKKRGNYSPLDAEAVYEELGTDRRFVKGGVNTVREVLKICSVYESRMRDQNLITYDDQVYLPLKIIGKEPRYLESAFQIEHIFVDEAQDLSVQNIELIKKLMALPSNKSTVFCGDDWQSIWRFKGGDPSIFINLPAQLGRPVEDVAMQTNFRSTQPIVSFANRIMDRNRVKLAKTPVAKNQAGDPVVVNGYYDRDDLWAAMSENIEDCRRAGIPDNQQIIISRVRSGVDFYMSALTEKGSATFSLCKTKMSDNSRVRAAISMLNAFQDPSDEISLFEYAFVKNNGAWEKNNCMIATEAEIKEAKASAGAELEECRLLKGKKKKKRLLELLEGLEHEPDEVYRSFVEKLSAKKTVNKMLEYSNYFYQFGSGNEGSYSQLGDGIRVSTVHGCKGLEFDVVHLDLSAFDSKGLREDDIEEVRRMIYVAVTRAKKKLYVYGKFSAYGSVSRCNLMPNRFLEECYRILGMDFDWQTYCKGKRAAVIAAVKARREAFSDSEKSAT